MIYTSSFFWFFVMFFFLFLEMGHPGLLYFLSFSCGAAGAGCISLFHISDTVQYAIFLLGTVVSLLVLHFIFKSKSHEKVMHHYTSNADALIGKKVIVFSSPEDQQVWQAQVLGQVWTIRAIDDKPLRQGQHVIVVGVQGCHLQVDYIS
jgi:membrane protein implicated in regulation of membrane protease activity